MFAGFAGELGAEPNLDQFGSIAIALCHCHPRTAFSADWTKTALPPFTWTDFTLPLDSTRTSSFPDPLSLMVRASSGYSGTTRLITLRASLSSSVWGPSRYSQPHETHQKTEVREQDLHLPRKKTGFVREGNKRVTLHETKVTSSYQ
jgi:hypothetical protein